MKNIFAFIKSIMSFLYGLSFGAFGIVCLVVGYVKGTETNKRDFRPYNKPIRYSDYFYNKPDPFDYYRGREE